MSFYPASSRSSTAVGLLAVSLVAGLSGCQRPVAHFQPGHREVFHSPAPTLPEQPGNVPDTAEPAPLAYAEANPATDAASERATRRPARLTYPVAERIGQHQANARRLLTPAPETGSPTDEYGPGPKKKKTLREVLGLPPRKKLNWWQRISWQLKAATVVIVVAVVFAILNITILAIIFGLVGAFLLIRGLKKSFKVRRGIFGLGRG